MMTIEYREYFELLLQRTPYTIRRQDAHSLIGLSNFDGSFERLRKTFQPIIDPFPREKRHYANISISHANYYLKS